LPLAIIDGDVLCYQACPPRWSPDDPIILDEDGHRVYPTFTPEQDRRYLENAWNILKNNITNLVDKLYCDDYLMAVGGQDNFRKAIFPNYKVNTSRQTRGKPPNVVVPVLRQLACHEGFAFAADGFEADDFVRTWANEARRDGVEHVICSIDKDLKCIPGTHYCLQKGKEGYFEVSEWEGMLFFYEQLVSGDPGDSIPGIPGLGPVKAKKHLAECTTEKELQEKVVEAYYGYYEEEWWDYLLANGRLLHISNYIGDYFDPTDWDIIKELR
jgi:hypothetical protein